MVVINKNSPWIRQDLSYWEDLIQNQIPILYHKNNFLFREGNPPEYVFIVKSGRVRVTSFHENGNEKQLYIGETGTICGEMASIQDRPYNSSALAIVDSEVFRLPSKLFESRIRASWPLTQKLMRLLCHKSFIFMGQIQELSFENSPQRVARILLNIAAQYGQELPDGGIQIVLNFTHQDIASMINTSRVTVNNIINGFSKKGIISREGGRYIIKDTAKLYDCILETQ